VLAPGGLGDPLQFIDVRDLAGWLVAAAKSKFGFSGIFNVTGRPVTFGDFLNCCAVPGADAELVWIPSERLLQAGLDPWMGVSLWIGAPGWEAANAVDVSRALATGLSYRRLQETIEGAVAFPGGAGSPPLPVELEVELLSQFGS
jgi:2'-hydroxyisoflavone reductase